MSLIWQICNGPNHLVEISIAAWRVVETQIYSSTRKLVDSIEEQYVLEELLDEHQPRIPEHCSQHHPLLSTPFRRPPLAYGSRFSTRIEPSIWYGATRLSTCLAEKAYYQLHFIRASAAQFGVIECPLTAFSVPIHSLKGIDLTRPPFKDHTNLISSPSTYTDSQSLGLSMRNHSIDAFLYLSARDPDQGTNIALFNATPFKNKHPSKSSFQAWHCTSTATGVEFTLSSSLKTETLVFPLDYFLVDDQLPFPAN